LGLDLGISTVKAALFDYEGRLLEMESDEYLIMPEGGKVEADPELYWAPLVAVIRRLLLKWGGEAEAVPPGSQGLLMLPHLEGALFPEYNAKARGVFFGMTLSHTRGHFVRAIMESVTFMIRRDLEGLDRLGAGARELRVLGGGAKSHLWSQIKADVCKVRVVTPAQPEAAVLGAAILAAVGAGLYPDIPAAVQRMTSSQEAIEPELTHREIYDSAYELYVSLYEAVKGLYSGCGRIEQLAARR
jgi:sugar (pentulose or hexulose) kinase